MHKVSTLTSLLVLLHQQKRDDKNARFIVNCSVTCEFLLLLSTKSEKLFAFMKNKSVNACGIKIKH